MAGREGPWLSTRVTSAAVLKRKTPLWSRRCTPTPSESSAVTALCVDTRKASGFPGVDHGVRLCCCEWIDYPPVTLVRREGVWVFDSGGISLSRAAPPRDSAARCGSSHPGSSEANSLREGAVRVGAYLHSTGWRSSLQSILCWSRFAAQDFIRQLR